MPTQTKPKRTNKRASKPKAPPVNVTLSTFDSRPIGESYRVLRSGRIGQFEPVNFDEYCPHGGTPLLDATAKFIAQLEEQRKRSPKSVTIGLLMDESGSMDPNRAAVVQGVNEFVDGMRDVENVDPDAAGKVLAVIVTDGDENSSREVTIDAVRSMIGEKEATGDWTFIYLGANQDAWREGSGFGLSGTASGQTVTTSGTLAGTRAAFSNVSKKSKDYLSDNSAYMLAASAAPVTTLDESGNEVEGSDPNAVRNGGMQVTRASGAWSSISYGDVSGALDKAKSSTKKGGKKKR